MDINEARRERKTCARDALECVLIGKITNNSNLAINDSEISRVRYAS
jgi:hypothetical protein